MPEDLMELSFERCCVRLNNGHETIAFCVAYMPCESNSDILGDKYQRILDALSLDCRIPQDEEIKNFINGDFPYCVPR